MNIQYLHFTLAMVILSLGIATYSSPIAAQEIYLVKDILPGSGSGLIDDEGSGGEMIDLNGILLFEGEGPDDGRELWRSDGTAEGTYQVKDINEGSNDSFPRDFVLFQDIVCFNARTGAGDVEPWRTDGTEEGTFRLKDINEGPDGSFPGNFVALGNLLFFAARDGDDTGLYRTDGTEGGTMKVVDINDTGEDNGNDNVDGLGRFGDEVFFSAWEPGAGVELFKSDGTALGTTLVEDINGGADSSNPRDLTAVGNLLFFSADDGDVGRELWKTDGTSPGTMLVKDIGPNGELEGQSQIGELTAFGNVLIFRAQEGDNDLKGIELWKSNGTEGGTTLLKEIRTSGPLGVGSIPEEFTLFKGELYFRANDGSTDVELWKTDGTEEGTMLVKDIAPFDGSNPADFTPFDDELYFRANEGTLANPLQSGSEVWKTDGTEEGTMLVRDLRPGTASSFPRNLTRSGGRLFFSARERTEIGIELYAIALNLPHMANISTRGQVGTGDNVMIAGFIIEGGRKRLLIRANGPSLDIHGVPNTLNDPLLKIFDDQTEIASNDDWRDTQETEIEATGLQPGFDVESAIILELDPGAYTAIVSGGIGNAIVEVFELD